MRKRARVAAAAGALGAACLLLLPLANGAGAQPQTLDSYTLIGKARGLTLTFAFKDFVIPQILDIGIPHAASDLDSSAGGSALSEASQAYPGDVIAGAADPQFPGGFPGYKHVAYPPGGTIDSTLTGSLFGHDTNIPTNIGPITVEHGHLMVKAQAAVSTAQATSQHVAFGPVEVASIQALSESTTDASRGQTVVRSVIHGITITPSPTLKITIGSLVSEAHSNSNGSQADGDATITVSDVRVVSSGQTFAATIDADGIHITGPVPQQIPNSLDQSLTLGVTGALTDLTDSGVTIQTAKPVRSADGGQSEASIGGLLISITGQIPNLPPFPDVVNQVIGPVLTTFPVICPPVPGLPVCLTPQAIPGPGNAGITTISIGNVDALAAASALEVGPPDLGGTTGGTTGLTTGSVANPGTTGGPLPTTTGGGTSTTGSPGSGPPLQLFGLAARMPSGALTGFGLGFLVVAVALAMGPSLRRWRSAE